MRILLLSQFYPPVIGGEERHVRNLGRALAQSGHAVSVGTSALSGSPDTELDGAVRVHRLRGTLQRWSGLYRDSERRHAPPFPDPELMRALRRLVSEERPDIVHAHNWIYASFLPLKAFGDARLVVTLHDYGLVCAKKTSCTSARICVRAGGSRNACPAPPLTTAPRRPPRLRWATGPRASQRGAWSTASSR